MKEESNGGRNQKSELKTVQTENFSKWKGTNRRWHCSKLPQHNWFYTMSSLNSLQLKDVLVNKLQCQC